AAVHACLESGARRVLALGVLHARAPELLEARDRVAGGGDPSAEPARGIQGPGLPGREEWRDQYSLSHFRLLWEHRRRRRGAGPELLLRYPFLAADQPGELRGIDALREEAGDAVVVATMDPVHHGIGYGTPPAEALSPEAGGLAMARRSIREGLALLRAGDY